MCQHQDTEPVTPAGTTAAVAEVCTTCLDPLPLGWTCPDCERHETQLLSGETIHHINRCPTHR